MYDSSLDDILDTLKQSMGKKQSARPTNDHSLCGMSAKSKSKKSTLPEEYKSNVFEKLYSEVLETITKRILLKNKKMKLYYETKRSRDEEYIQRCTFSPNIRSRMSTTPRDDESFYVRNLEWQERRNRYVKRQQCERNEEKLKDVTLTPRIVSELLTKNAYKQQKYNNQSTIIKKSGVVNFLNRQKKAQVEREYISFRKAVPNAHTWNVKKGIFSEIK